MSYKESTYFVLVTVMVLYLSSETCLAQKMVYKDVFSQDSRTTPHLKEIFLGRCWDYQVGFNRAFYNTSNLKNCTLLWELFQEVFICKDPRDVTRDMYEPFIQEAMQPVGVNKTLFWSGTYYLAHTVGSETRRFTTLEDTLMGYLLNRLVWCSQIDYSGINDESCSGYCLMDAQFKYWEAASINFAKQASGVVTVMLNGSREGGAFRDDSLFAKYELPNLNATKVTSITIMVINSLDGPKGESCGEGSVSTLENQLQELGFKYKCVYNPDAIRFIQCSENPKSLDCEAWHYGQKFQCRPMP